MVTHTAETCLGVLKQSAKNLLKSAKSGNPVASKLFEQYFENSSKNRSELKLSQAQLVIARECGFASWPKLKSGLEQLPEQYELPPAVLFNNLVEKIAHRITADDTGTKSKPENQDDVKTNFCRSCRKSKDQVKMHITTPTFSVCVDCVDDYNKFLAPIGAITKSKQEKLDKPRLLRCHFCFKTQHDVRKLIAGPLVFICDECVGLCNKVIADAEEGIET